MALSPVIELSGGRLEPPSVIVVQATIHSKADSSGRELCRNEDWLLSFAWRLLGSVYGFARQSLYLRLEPHTTTSYSSGWHITSEVVSGSDPSIK